MHIHTLEYMFHHKSPPGRYYSPRIIKPDLEEIEVIISGYGEFKKNRQTVRFGPGSSVWYYAGDVVEVTADSKNPYETIVFCYRVSCVPNVRMPFYSEWDNTASCSSFCHKAFNSYKMENLDLNFLTSCSYARLIWEATEFSKQKQNLQRPLQVTRAITYIEKNFIDGIRINDIANTAGVSTSHLHLLFRRYIHASPIQYLLKLRINKAQELLTNSTLSVKQICFETGFSDFKNFCSYFKRQNNLTPTQYRLLTSGK
jgi:AraC-like DNA-binding protein